MTIRYTKFLLVFLFLTGINSLVQAQAGTLTLVEPENFEDLFPLDPKQEYRLLLAYDFIFTPGVDTVDESTLDLTLLVDDKRSDAAAIIVDGPNVILPNLIELIFRPLSNNLILNLCIDDNQISTIGSKAVYRSEALVVPVKFASFDGRQINDEVQLDWKTDLEVNNDMFYVERSYSDNGYSIIGEVEGSGNDNGTNTYKFMDQAPLSGTNLYRLTQVDFNGKKTYSESIAVDFKSDIQVKVTPNPASQAVQPTLFVNSPSAGTGTIAVYGISGQTVSEQQVDVAKGGNEFQVSTNGWTNAGLYVVRFLKDDMNKSVKVYFER